MSDPLVCAICLVNGRPAMAYRAIASFRAQTYSNAVLVVWDTGAQRVEPKQEPFDRVWWQIGSPKSIGAMRNDAIAWALSGPTQHPDIFVHADSDDVMHPQRIAEQVALLQSLGTDCVGYRECAFWDSRVCRSCKYGQPYLDPQDDRPGRWHGTSLGPHRCDSTAWIYDSRAPNRIVGASMMYTRAAWERNKFRDLNTGEDYHFAMRCSVVGVSGIVDGEPRLVCNIHGSNTADYRELSRQTWRRAVELDNICAERMRL